MCPVQNITATGESSNLNQRESRFSGPGFMNNQISSSFIDSKVMITKLKSPIYPNSAAAMASYAAMRSL